MVDGADRREKQMKMTHIVTPSCLFILFLLSCTMVAYPDSYSSSYFNIRIKIATLFRATDAYLHGWLINWRF